MNEIEQAIKSFEHLASGAPIGNILFGKPKDYFNDICRLASKALQEQLEREQQPKANLIRINSSDIECTVCGYVEDTEGYAVDWKYCPGCGRELEVAE